MYPALIPHCMTEILAKECKNGKSTVLALVTVYKLHVRIRLSVDGLCKDGPNEISCDPRTKRLQTQPKRLGWL